MIEAQIPILACVGSNAPLGGSGLPQPLWHLLLAKLHILIKSGALIITCKYRKFVHFTFITQMMRFWEIPQIIELHGRNSKYDANKLEHDLLNFKIHGNVSDVSVAHDFGARCGEHHVYGNDAVAESTIQ
jgi:hypothetical protein